MPYEIGTATDYKDLLTKVKDFATTANSIVAVADPGNTGNGVVTGDSAENDAPTETWILTATTIGPTATFTVVGSVSGSKANATSASAYDNGIIAFTITDGGTAWAIDDKFTFTVTQGMGSFVWTTDRWDTDYDGNGNYDWIAHGPGSTDDDEVYIGIRTFFSDSIQYYNWQVGGFTGFEDVNWENMPGAINSVYEYRNGPAVLLNNDTMKYWILGNGRRICGVVKVDTNYAWFYLGLIIPYGLPSSFPYPLFIGGDSPKHDGATGYMRFSHSTTYHRPYWQGPNTVNGSYGAWFFLGGWQALHVWTTSIRYHSKCFWPYIHGVYRTATTYSDFYTLATWNAENLDGSTTLFPLVLHFSSPDRNVPGELDGVFFCWGGNQTSEDNFTIDGTTYIKFQACVNAAQGDFAALKLE